VPSSRPRSAETIHLARRITQVIQLAHLYFAPTWKRKCAKRHTLWMTNLQSMQPLFDRLENPLMKSARADCCVRCGPLAFCIGEHLLLALSLRQRCGSAHLIIGNSKTGVRKGSKGCVAACTPRHLSLPSFPSLLANPCFHLRAVLYGWLNARVRVGRRRACECKGGECVNMNNDVYFTHLTHTRQSGQHFPVLSVRDIFLWVIFHFGTSTPKYSMLGKIFRFGHSGKFQYSI
jgi:hypothetical protein